MRILNYDTTPDRRAKETQAERLQFLYDKFVAELEPLLRERKGTTRGNRPKNTARVTALVDAIGRVKDQAVIHNVQLAMKDLRNLT